MGDRWINGAKGKMKLVEQMRGGKNVSRKRRGVVRCEWTTICERWGKIDVGQSITSPCTLVLFFREDGTCDNTLQGLLSQHCTAL